MTTRSWEEKAKTFTAWFYVVFGVALVVVVASNWQSFKTQVSGTVNKYLQTDPSNVITVYKVSCEKSGPNVNAGRKSDSSAD